MWKWLSCTHPWTGNAVVCMPGQWEAVQLQNNMPAHKRFLRRLHSGTWFVFDQPPKCQTAVQQTFTPSVTELWTITVMVRQIYTLLEERYYTQQSQQQEQSLIVRNCSCCPSIRARLFGWNHNRRTKRGRVRRFQKSTVWNLVSKLCVFRRKRHYYVSEQAKSNKSLPL